MASNQPWPVSASTRAATSAFRSARLSRKVAGVRGRITAARMRRWTSPSLWMTLLPLGALKAALKPTPSPLINASELRSAACTSAKRPMA